MYSEIVEYTSPGETAVCTLASINLSKFVDIENSTMFYNKIADVAGKATMNLNKTIDYSFYPTECSKNSHMKHRPLGLGVSGLQDVFFKLKIGFDSDKAKAINKRIMESIYFGAVSMSMELAKIHGPYESFQGSPASEGQLNFDLWDTEPDPDLDFDWQTLKTNIREHGIRNSLFVALMPTASSASILGVTECFEPQKSNFYKRQVLAGEFWLINKYLVNDLKKLNLWNESMANKILKNNGSVQDINEIPHNIRHVYRTAFELSNKAIIDMAADRNPWVDQSQSLNLFVKPSDDIINTLNSMYFYGFQKKLKTLVYYLRTQKVDEDVKFGVEFEKQETIFTTKDDGEEDEEGDCISCQA